MNAAAAASYTVQPPPNSSFSLSSRTEICRIVFGGNNIQTWTLIKSLESRRTTDLSGSTLKFVLLFVAQNQISWPEKTQCRSPPQPRRQVEASTRPPEKKITE